jgi:hypothetical protein
VTQGMPLTVLVCGGRDFGDRDALFALLDALVASLPTSLPIGLVIHGDARGADRLGGMWARQRGIAVKVFPANWNLHGRAAGGIRNQTMLDYLLTLPPDRRLVVAFPGGRGTADMAARAKAANVPVIQPPES